LRESDHHIIENNNKYDKYAKEIQNCHYAAIPLFNDSGNYIASEKFYVTDINIPFAGILGGTFIQKHLLFMDSDNKFIQIC
jgi:hypothetical protein